MSTPSLPPLLQPGPFRERLIVYLLPYFMPLIDNFDRARTEVLETLASYGARTRSEMINAARIIAFSFTSLEVLAEATAGEMPYALRVRYRNCANNLNRSCQQIEARFEKSLASDPPAQPEAEAEPPGDMPQSVFEAALLQAQATIETHRDRPSAARPATLLPAAFASRQHPAGLPWSAATTQDEQPPSARNHRTGPRPLDRPPERHTSPR